MQVTFSRKSTFCKVIKVLWLNRSMSCFRPRGARWSTKTQQNGNSSWFRLFAWWANRRIHKTSGRHPRRRFALYNSCLCVFARRGEGCKHDNSWLWRVILFLTFRLFAMIHEKLKLSWLRVARLKCKNATKLIIQVL